MRESLYLQAFLDRGPSGWLQDALFVSDAIRLRTVGRNEGRKMRTWDRLSATFVRGLKKPGDYGDGGGLMLQAEC